MSHFVVLAWINGVGSLGWEDTRVFELIFLSLSSVFSFLTSRTRGFHNADETFARCESPYYNLACY